MKDKDDKEFLARKWWENSIIDMQSGSISFRGHPIEELMETKSFTQMIFHMVLGRNITQEESKLFEVAMVMSVDHGPQAPSIAIARMASTCGIGINNVLASAINVLGDNHGGAGQGCAELFYSIESDINNGMSLENSTEKNLNEYIAQHGKIIPGFGHRFHKPSDPRATKTIEIVKKYVKEGHVKGLFTSIALEVHRQINLKKSSPIPINVDGASAIIFCELGIPPLLCRGFFCLSRSIGILAHSWEEMQNGAKNKGPMPKEFIPLYTHKNNSDD